MNYDLLCYCTTVLLLYLYTGYLLYIWYEDAQAPGFARNICSQLCQQTNRSQNSRVQDHNNISEKRSVNFTLPGMVLSFGSLLGLRLFEVLGFSGCRVAAHKKIILVPVFTRTRMPCSEPFLCRATGRSHYVKQTARGNLWNVGGHKIDDRK